MGRTIFIPLRTSIRKSTTTLLPVGWEIKRDELSLDWFYRLRQHKNQCIFLKIITKESMSLLLKGKKRNMPQKHQDQSDDWQAPNYTKSS